MTKTHRSLKLLVEFVWDTFSHISFAFLSPTSTSLMQDIVVVGDRTPMLKNPTPQKIALEFN